MPERLITGSFTGTGSSNTMSNHATLDSEKKMTVSIGGTFSATMDVERSYDAGGTWNIVKTYTAPIEENLDTPTDAFIYRLTCRIYTSGTVNYALAK